MSLDKLKPYSKAIVAIVGALATVAVQSFPQNAAVQQWGTIVLAVLTAGGVYAVPNQPLVARHLSEVPAPDKPGGYWDGI